MKSLLLNCFILFIFGINVVSCQNKEENSLQIIQGWKSPAGLVKKYVDDNTYIHLDVYGLAKKVASPTTRSTVDNTDELAQMKATLYRFYSHVKLVDGFYVCDLTSAKEINVSTDVYTALLNNLNEMNSFIKKVKEEGKEPVVSNVDENYLNSLLE